MSETVKNESIYQVRDGMEFYNPEREDIYKRFDEFIDIVFVKGKQIDWEKSCNENKLVASDENFSELLGEEGKKVYSPLLEKNKKGKEKWMGEYSSSKNEINGEWAQDKNKNMWAKAVEQDQNLKKLLNHLTYVWSLGPVMKTKLYEDGIDITNEMIFPEIGLWASGLGTTQKPEDFYSLVLLMEYVLRKKESGEFAEIEKNIPNYIITYFTTDDYKEKNPPIKNAFLHFCNAGKYAPVSVKSTKDNIRKNLSFVLSSEERESLEKKSNDDWILEIHKKLKELEITDKKNGCIFFEPNVNIFINNKDDGVSDYSILKFKKSVILYGPPGTSKTYSAMELAKAVLFEYYIKNAGKNKDLFKKNKTGDDGLIHRLQLHPNYSYEDFIWGYEIKDDDKGATVSKPKKGYFINLLEKMTDGTPHILILDEINRVDLSRLFGELFSAIENRDDDIELPISFDDANNKYKIKVPKELYIIGTMNEIDFSLERIDFALRRRFSWIFKGYDKDVLKQMINRKDCKNYDYDDFIASCTALNKAIDKDSELGVQYEIGHAIFAEIATLRENVNKDLKLAQKILWNISIKPLLEAYLGNIEKKELENKINDFAISFGIKKDKMKKGEDENLDSDISEEE